MWRERVSGVFEDARFNAPCTAGEIASAERELQVALPEELKALLLETNGLAAYYGTDLVWSIEHMVAQNQLFREDADFAVLYMSFSSLLFFGDGGNGDQFAYRVLAGQVRDREIYKWDHENDSRVWQANHLEDFFRRWAANPG